MHDRQQPTKNIKTANLKTREKNCQVDNHIH